MWHQKHRRRNFSSRFEDWLCCLCKMKMQTSYNYRNLFELISVAPKLMNCRVSTTNFIRNYEILLKYFDELETQTHCIILLPRFVTSFYQTTQADFCLNSGLIIPLSWNILTTSGIVFLKSMCD